MRLSKSLLRSAILLAAVAAAGCDRDVNEATAPATVPTAPNALVVPTAGYTHVASHSFYSCAIRADNGDAVCWGYNAYGATTRWPGNYTQVSAGLDVACALRTDGIAECWGGWQVGQDDPPAVALIDVGAGNTYGCGIRDTFALVCWGDTSFSAAVPPAGMYGMLSVGDLRACAIRVADRGVTCWGEGDLSAPAGVFGQISVGMSHTCGVRLDYTVSCWGSNDYGQSNAPSGTFTQVSAGDYHTCAIRATDQSIVCWGFDSGGRLSPPAGAYKEVSAVRDCSCSSEMCDERGRTTYRARQGHRSGRRHRVVLGHRSDQQSASDRDYHIHTAESRLCERDVRRERDCVVRSASYGERVPT